MTKSPQKRSKARTEQIARIRCPVPENELELLNPLPEPCSMLELGNKKNKLGPYKKWFRAQGIGHTSVDWNGKDGALPLNLTEPNEFFCNRNFDVVTNFGTTEHCGTTLKSQEQVWRNIFFACNNLLVSVTPLPGDWVWHGTWYPTERFFKKLGGFEIERLYIGGEEPRRCVHARLVKTDGEFFFPKNEVFVNG